MKRKELEKFFDYILDKVEECYKKEVEMAIKEFLKGTDLEVPVQDQLNRDEFECIFRHLNMFVKINWDEKGNVPDACTGCSHSCSEDIQELNPWPTFYKLANLAEASSAVEMEHLDKQGNVPTCP